MCIFSVKKKPAVSLILVVFILTTTERKMYKIEIIREHGCFYLAKTEGSHRGKENLYLIYHLQVLFWLMSMEM